ncbi:carboxylesterase family protein [Aquincola sp. S2]|uniref:Carboxylic ester hydrolase n=1 Tax=Pseudaquabacterium terrae TaxID=2732868 RepID=A0ABX2ESM1_9BURK|nr:carboxylesterase family protein [Aquabacterium terrae]NRF71500.1 carboxylesterase family protein [Aquabacterium terrae]
MKIDTQPAAHGVLTRRRLLLGGAALAPLALWGCGGGSSGDDEAVVSTSSGRFRGQAEGSVTAWRGVPYAQPPVGALRFRSPQPVQPASGIVDATRFGPASIQSIGSGVAWIYPVQDQQSEDCLTLNVWTAQTTGKRPVIVWLHGGGFRTGATRMPLMNGRALAERGVVVVTVNYRLGAFGLLSHPDFTDPGNGSITNWQLQDMGAALQWVRQNIAEFGGDPNQVTVMGQSGGAMHTALLAQTPAYRACFQRAVLLSPPTLQPPVSMTLADANAYTELLASRLGTTPRGLRDIPAQALHAAELALNAQPLPAGFTSGKAWKLAPVIDGKTYLADWTRTPWPADLPVAITYTLDEGAFWLDLYDPLSGKLLTQALPGSTAALTGAVLPQVGSPGAAAAVIDAYTQAALAEGRSTAPGDVWIDIFGDRLLRVHGTRYAATIAKAGAPVRFGTFMHPVMSPGRGVPHCAELPLVFSTYALDYYKGKVGAGPTQSMLSDEVIGSIVSFARDAEPRLASGRAWPLYQPGGASSVRWGEGGTAAEVIGAVPKVEQLKVWDSIPGV